MSKTIQTMLFVLIVGVFTSILLVGMDSITAERIEQNEEALLQSAILDGFDVEYTFGNITTVFEENVNVYEYEDLTFYEHESSGRLSFRFEGGGVWGPIIGILTLESDLETIAEISILEQEETPGLGGVVAERDYLDTFVGKEFDIDIVKGATNLNDSQIDSITGATRTSDAFENILNTDYDEHVSVWQENQE